MFLMADQPLLPVNLTAVAKDFGLDDHERDEQLGGAVAVVFFSAGALTSLIAGRLADLVSRRRLLAAFLVIGGVGCFANSRISTYDELLLCRAAVGVAMGGVIPVTFAVVGDLYPPEERPHAIAMLSVIVGAGPAIGQVLAGSLGSTVGWRVPFAIVGAATTLFGLLLPRLMAEPKPAAAEDDVEPVLPQAPGKEEPPMEEGASSPLSVAAASQDDVLPDLPPAKDNLGPPAVAGAVANVISGALAAATAARAALGRLLATPTVLLVFLQGAAGCVPWAVIQTFLTDFLAVDSELGVGGATAVMFAFGAGSTVGTVSGGRFGQYLYRKSKRLQPLLMGMTAVGGTVPMVLLVGLPAGSHPLLFYLLAFLGGSQVAVGGGNAKAVLMNTSPQEMRGTAFGIYNIMDDLGKGFGPAFVARWVRRLGRRISFALGLSFWVPCGVFCLLMCLTVVRDEAALARGRSGGKAPGAAGRAEKREEGGKAAW